MKKVIVLNKKEGETPLQALELFRSKNKEYKDVPMTYAGRLDPMASGLMVILTGEECKKKEKYLNLNKEYSFEILFGFATDSYDILGKVNKVSKIDIDKNNLEKEITENLKYFRGKIIQKYPAYSSKNIKNVLAGEKVNDSEREVKVKKLEFIKLRKISAEKLLENIEKRIAKVKGDFRQKEILKIWKQELRQKKSQKESAGFFLASFHISCTSGTYVRTISHDLGTQIGIPASAFSIKRTKVGKYSKI